MRSEMPECVSEKFLNRSFPFIHSSFFLVVGAVLCDSKKFFRLPLEQEKGKDKKGLCVVTACELC
jgi:hypothetical protein